MCKTFPRVYNSAKIIKIHQDFPKLWSQMFCHFFMVHSVLSYLVEFIPPLWDIGWRVSSTSCSHWQLSFLLSMWLPLGLLVELPWRWPAIMSSVVFLVFICQFVAALAPAFSLVVLSVCVEQDSISWLLIYLTEVITSPFLRSVSTTRVHGPWTRAENSGSGNRP